MSELLPSTGRANAPMRAKGATRLNRKPSFSPDRGDAPMRAKGPKRPNRSLNSSAHTG